MESLVQYGHVTRGYLGVMIQDLTPDLASEFNLKNSGGALIGEVVPNGPAGQAGFKDGDVVVKFNGEQVTDSRNLQLDVASVKPDTKVPVEIIRNGEQKTLEVTVKQQPGTEQLAENGSSSSDTGTLNGVGVGDLDQQARQQYNIPKDVTGALITQVDPSSPSAEAGLHAGEVIESINRHPVKNADEAVQMTEHGAGKTLVRVWDHNGSHYVVVDETKQTG